MFPKPCIFTKPLFFLLSIWLCLATLTACGQRGPLYLPEDQPAEVQPEDETSKPADDENV